MFSLRSSFRGVGNPRQREFSVAEMNANQTDFERGALEWRQLEAGEMF